MDEDRTKRTLSDDEITTTRSRERRRFLKSIGVIVLGAAATVVNSQRASASDPSPNNDSDVTVNADFKGRDSDSKDPAPDNNQSRLRDYKKSSDND